MRAGKLDRMITIEAATATIAADGTPSTLWTPVATVRAQRVEMSTEEYLRGYGETDETIVVLRIRWLDGVTTAHRVQHEGRSLNIRETKEIGRRRGLELRCQEVRT